MQEKGGTEQLGEIRASISTGVKGVPYTIARAPNEALHSSVSEKAKKVNSRAADPALNRAMSLLI